jgi:sugar porter (SP) family MFS transporter
MYQLYISTFFASLGMFQFGYQSAVLNVPQIQVEKFFKDTFRRRNLGNISDSTTITLFSVATSLTLVGGVIGAIASGWIGNKFGRRNALIYLQLVVLSAASLGGICDVCRSFEMLFISRFLAGFASGVFTSLVPLYVSEIAPIHLRGSAATSCNLTCCIGTLMAMVLGQNEFIGKPDMWPYVLFVPAVPAILQLVFMPFMPESPRYLLINKRNLEGARRSLTLLRGGINVEEEIEEMLEEKKNREANDSAEISESTEQLLGNHETVLQVLKESKYWLPLFICICMQVSSQATGVVALIFYSTKFFQEAGISCSLSSLSSVSIGGIFVIMTLLSVILMERLGRRTLHVYIGLSGMLISSVVLNFALIQEGKKGNGGGSINMTTNVDCSNPNVTTGIKDGEESIYGILVVVSSLVCVMLFALGPGSIPYFITSEIFEEAPRAAATSIVMFSNWSMQIAVALAFPQLQSSLGSYSFLPFLFILLMTWIILVFYLPETKNQSSSKISRLFQQPNAWYKSIGFQSPECLNDLNDNSFGT